MVVNRKVNKDIDILHYFLDVKGFGFKSAKLLCYQCGVLPKTKIKTLTGTQKSFVFNWVDSFFKSTLYGERFVREKESRLKELKKLKNIKSYRFFLGLPTNGQRTQTNAKTSKKLNGKSLYSSRTK